MNEQELLNRIMKFNDDIVDNCSRVIGHLENQHCNLPWEDMTDYHKGFIKAIQLSLKNLNELKYKRNKE